jgi:hypothetical protein
MTAADVAQFTPKTVETAEERLKLVFRIKAHIEPELLRKYIRTPSRIPWSGPVSSPTTQRTRRRRSCRKTHVIEWRR